MKTLGDKIKEARNDMNFSQRDLAKAMGCNQTNIARYELNEQSPTVKRLQEIAKATNKKASWFLEDIEN